MEATDIQPQREAHPFLGAGSQDKRTDCPMVPPEDCDLSEVTSGELDTPASTGLKMFQPWGLVFLWGFLMMPPAQAEPRGQAVLNIGPEILNKVFFQELKNQDVIEILKNLPLYEAMKKNQVSSIPLIGDLVSSFLKQIVWLRVTEASIPKLAFQLSEKGHLQIRIPMDMVAGLNTIISKKLIELHMEVAIIAEVSTVTDVPGNSHVVLSQCTDIPSNLRIELLQTFSFAINILANKVIDALMPTLPTLVKREVCPVIERAFKSMTSKINIWATLPVPIGSNFMDFEVLSSSIVDNTFQLDLNAQLLDMGGKLMKVFNDSQGSLTVPKMDGLKFNFIVRQDVVSAAIGALLPPKELAVLLDSVLPELARELKSILNNINPTASEQLGPTQIVKIFTQEPPEIILKVGSARVLQLIVFEVFATNQATRPLFTLGIETSSDGQFYTEESRLYLNIKGISSDHIYLMNSGTGLFSVCKDPVYANSHVKDKVMTSIQSNGNPELLGSVINEILLSVLLPNQNGVLRDGISLSAFREYGFDEAKVIPIQGALLITPA